MLRPTAALAALLALAACGRSPAPVVAADDPPPSPLIVECREEARRSPQIARSHARESNIDNGMNVLRLREERLDAEDRAFQDCLRRRGAPMPGGVERVRG